MTEDLEIVNGHALEQMQRAEIDVQISTAKRYPRTLSKVKADMLTFATLDEETAQGCFYSLPRGGKNIQGPSVRLAEIAVSCYGNLRAGSRVISVVASGDAPHVVVQAVAHDLEKNTSVTIEKRRRITKKKSKATIDEDDINLAANAGSAIAFRDAVYKVIPLALIKPVYEAARSVAIGDAKTLADRRARAIESLNKMGVTTPRILVALDKRSVEDINVEDLGDLFGRFNAIKDGASTVEDAFPEPVAVETKKEDDSNPDLKPADNAQKKPPMPAKGLGDIVVEAGFTFDQFVAYSKEVGPADAKPDDWASFDDVPADWAARCVKASKGMITGLKAVAATQGGAK